MTITDVTCTVLVVPECNANACDSAQDTVVVEVQTDEGLTGIGETDANPWVIKAIIEAPGSHIMSLGLKELVVGQNPTEPVALWDRLYKFTAMTGRRGAGVCSRRPVGRASLVVVQPRWKSASRGPTRTTSCGKAMTRL